MGKVKSSWVELRQAFFLKRNKSLLRKKFLCDPLEGRVIPLNKTFLRRRGWGEWKRKNGMAPERIQNIQVLEIWRNTCTICGHEMWRCTPQNGRALSGGTSHHGSTATRELVQVQPCRSCAGPSTSLWTAVSFLSGVSPHPLVTKA